MKAFILVGGQGTRLLPLTTNRPKAMVPVLNKPLLEYVIRHLAGYNIKDIILSQGILGQPIKDYFGDGSRFGVRLSYVREETPLGTAGAVKNAQEFLSNTFMVLNGDIFTDLDLGKMASRHRQKKARVTIALTPVADPSNYGLVETGPDDRVRRFLEKPSPDQISGNNINAGVYIMEADVLSHIPEKTSFSFERQVFPQLLESGRAVYGYLSSAYWIDIGDPPKYFQLNKDLLNGKSDQYLLSPGNEVAIGKSCRIYATAEIRGPVLIGDNCTIGRKVIINGPTVIGDGCRIGSGAVIEEAIIWPAIEMGPGSSITKSIIADHCHLGAASTIKDSVLSDNITIPEGCHLKPGSQIEPGAIVSQIF